MVREHSLKTRTSILYDFSLEINMLLEFSKIRKKQGD
jgi:hypothetical protein